MFGLASFEKSMFFTLFIINGQRTVVNVLVVGYNERMKGCLNKLIVLTLLFLWTSTIKIYDENHNLSGYILDTGSDRLNVYDKNGAVKGIIKRTDSTMQYYDTDNKYKGMIRKGRIYDKDNSLKGYVRDGKIYDKNNRYRGYYRQGR